MEEARSDVKRGKMLRKEREGSDASRGTAAAAIHQKDYFPDFAFALSPTRHFLLLYEEAIPKNANIFLNWHLVVLTVNIFSCEVASIAANLLFPHLH